MTNEAMTDAELHALIGLAEKATPGPYRVSHETPEYMQPYDAVIASDNSRSRVCVYTNDANFISACTPERIEALAEEVLALRAATREQTAPLSEETP